MTRKDVEKLELRMRTIRQCLREDFEALWDVKEKMNGDYLHTESVDYVIEYVKAKVARMQLDIGMFERTMDVEMRECFHFLRENCKENSGAVPAQNDMPKSEDKEMEDNIEWLVDCTPLKELMTCENIVPFCQFLRYDKFSMK